MLITRKNLTRPVPVVITVTYSSLLVGPAVSWLCVSCVVLYLCLFDFVFCVCIFMLFSMSVRFIPSMVTYFYGCKPPKDYWLPDPFFLFFMFCLSLFCVLLFVLYVCLLYSFCFEKTGTVVDMLGTGDNTTYTAKPWLT